MEFNYQDKNGYRSSYGTTYNKLEKNKSIASLCYAVAVACFLIVMIMTLQYYEYI